MPLFVCIPLYSFPHLILEGAPFSHAFKPLKKYKPTQELHFHLYVLSIVLFFSSESPHIFGPVTGRFPWAEITNASSLFPLPFVHFLFCSSCCLLLAICLYPLFSFHHEPKSWEEASKYRLYPLYYNKLTLAEEFLDTKKKQLSNESLCNFTIFYLCFWLKCFYELTYYC